MQNMTKSTREPWTFPHLIKTEGDYALALQKMYGWMQRDDIVPNTPDGDDFEHLAILIETYEKEHYPIGPPHPIEAIKFHAEQKGVTESSLTKLFGSRSRKAEILSGKRKLSLAMIRRISAELGISADVLVQPY